MAVLADEFSPDSVAALGAELGQAWPEFPLDRWQPLAADGLGPLALLERIDHIADALVACLPTEFGQAADILYRALESPTFTGWISLPCCRFVAVAGIEHPDIALPLLAALSPRFSSEWPIRAFIERYPELTFTYLHQWVNHDDDHVRRLVSECTRPRLPWASQLRDLITDPAPAIELLDLLFDDPSKYVRQSVANHLNDISKDHPQLAVDIASRWLDASTHGDRVVRHGLRSLIKKGDPAALTLMGFDPNVEVTLESLTVEPPRIAIGEVVTLEAELTVGITTGVVIDYVVHYQGVKKAKAGKVFKLGTRTIEPGKLCAVRKQHRFNHVSIRRIHPGPHRIEIQVNGTVLGGADVLVEAEPGGDR